MPAAIWNKARPALHPNPARTQRGDALLEAMIGTVLLGIVGLGTTMVAARAVNSQRYAATQGAVVQQIRQTVATQGVDLLCASKEHTMLVQSASAPTATALTVPLQSDCTSHAVRVGVASQSQFAVQLPHTIQHLKLHTDPSNTAVQSWIGPGSISVAQ